MNTRYNRWLAQTAKANGLRSADTSDMLAKPRILPEDMDKMYRVAIAKQARTSQDLFESCGGKDVLDVIKRLKLAESK